MKINFEESDRRLINEVAARYDLSPAGLARTYMEVMDSNFEQDLHDIANENLDSIAEQYGRVSDGKSYSTIIIDNRDLPVGSIDTYQTFTGSSTFEYMEEMAREHLKEEGKDPDDYNYDDLDVDMKTVVEDLAIASVNWLKCYLTGRPEGIVCNINGPQSTGSPKEYNYTTDHYTAAWTINQKRLEQFVEDRRERYEKFIETGETNTWKRTLDIYQDQLDDAREDLAEVQRNKAEGKVVKYFEERLAERENNLKTGTLTAKLAFYIDDVVDADEYTDAMYESESDIYYNNSEINPKEDIQ